MRAKPGGRGTPAATALLLAAGPGEPDGPGGPVLLAPLGGQPVAAHALAAFGAAAGIGEIVVACPPALAAPLGELIAERDSGPAARVVVSDGPRAEVVRRVLAGLGDGAGNVLVHDLTRPLVSQRVIGECLTALRTHRAVCAAVPAADTMVAVTDGVITARPPREQLRRRQSPQGFRLDVLRRALELAAAGGDGPGDQDEAAAVLRCLPEVPVALVWGSEQNFPVTGPADLEIAEAMLAAGLP